MTKKVIAIISVLKPVDDTRNYRKIARTISNTNKYDINIIGFSAKKIPLCPNVKFHPIFNFRRSSIKRLTASFQILKVLLKVKPELIIVTCTELLLVSVTYKILFGIKIIYDIQENYFRNIVYTDAYSPLIKYPIALLIRLNELASSLFVNRFFLAEKIYRDQLRFAASNSVTIENKAFIPAYLNFDIRQNTKDLIFVYSGTIAEHYGIFKAIELVIGLRHKDKNAHLIIAGYAAQLKIYHKLVDRVARLEFIKLIGGNQLVPHDQILMEIKKADFCLLPYHTNKSTQGRIPTKLYECLVLEKPVIIPSNPAWDELIKKNNAGILYEFKQLDKFPFEKLYSKFYGNDLTNESRWESISSILIDEVERILS
jgi:glycosyltransferase involved in cell wall biosynthesis